MLVVVPDPPQAARSKSALTASRHNHARLKYFRPGTVPEVIDLFESIFFSTFGTAIVRIGTVYLSYLPW